MHVTPFRPVIKKTISYLEKVIYSLINHHSFMPHSKFEMTVQRNVEYNKRGFGYTYIKEVSFLKADKASGEAPYGEHDDGEAAPLSIPESHLGHNHIELQTHFLFE